MKGQLKNSMEFPGGDPKKRSSKDFLPMGIKNPQQVDTMQSIDGGLSDMSPLKSVMSKGGKSTTGKKKQASLNKSQISVSKTVQENTKKPPKKKRNKEKR